MLTAHVERYLALRNALGAKLREVARNLRDFARFADARGDTHVRTEAAVAWATQASTADGRYRRLMDVIRLGRFLHAEDPAHQVPPRHVFVSQKGRQTPYIYSAEELARILDAAGRLRVARHPNPLGRQTYVMLFGLLACTGMRVSEALNLKRCDLMADGVLRIRDTKFGKSRFVPLHPSVAHELQRYLRQRQKVPSASDHVFLSANTKPIVHSTVFHSFRRILQLAGIGPRNGRWPRIHDLRHSFATRVLEQCAMHGDEVARHVVALSTYLGHVDIVSTYWYQEATPELLASMARAAEVLVAEEVQ